MRTKADGGPGVAGRSYGGKTPLERDSARRVRLHEAALDLFSAQGFAVTTIDAMCARARVSTLHFYQMFKDKEALLGQVYDLAVGKCIQRNRAAYEQTRGQPLSERVGTAYVAYLSPMIADPRVARIVFVSAVGVSPAMARKQETFREAVNASFVRAAGAGKDLNEADLTRLRYQGLALVGASETIVHDWVINPENHTVAQLEQMVGSIATLLTAN